MHANILSMTLRFFYRLPLSCLEFSAKRSTGYTVVRFSALKGGTHRSIHTLGPSRLHLAIKMRNLPESWPFIPVPGSRRQKVSQRIVGKFMAPSTEQVVTKLSCCSHRHPARISTIGSGRTGVVGIRGPQSTQGVETNPSAPRSCDPRL